MKFNWLKRKDKNTIVVTIRPEDRLQGHYMDIENCAIMATALKKAGYKAVRASGTGATIDGKVYCLKPMFPTANHIHDFYNGRTEPLTITLIVC